MKIYYINKCADCKYCEVDYYTWVLYCAKENRIIGDYFTDNVIPEWCKLKIHLSK